MSLKNIIKKKLKNYKIALNQPDPQAAPKISEPKKAVIVGGGIAGLVAAMELAEKGFNVTIYERNSYWGGKLGSWTFEQNGKTLRTTHGFHAFFNQYYNLLNWMEKHDLAKYLQPIDDYKVMFSEKESMGFKGIENTPGLNILDLRKKGVFPWYTYFNPLSIPFLSLLKYDPVKTFKHYDNISYGEFARRTMMPAKMRVVFNSFARAFFSEPDKMSMAELIKSFHFYFLSNDKGLIYQSLDDDFEYTFLAPVVTKLKGLGVTMHLNSEVTTFKKLDTGFEVENEYFDYALIGSDVKGTKKLMEMSNGLEAADFAKIEAMKHSDYYAVYRIWTDKFEDKEWPYFVITDKKRALDSITFYHKTEKESAKWSAENNGGIFELHSYSLPSDLTDEEEIKQALLDEFFDFIPELKGLNIVHDYFQLRNDFPAFHVGQNEKRIGVEAATENLYFIGDWVKLNNPSMLMEAACTSAIEACNKICAKEKVKETQLFTVPEKGLLA